MVKGFGSPEFPNQRLIQVDKADAPEEWREEHELKNLEIDLDLLDSEIPEGARELELFCERMKALVASLCRQTANITANEIHPHFKTKENPKLVRKALAFALEKLVQVESKLDRVKN